jgi:hypothetical protein
VLALQEATKQTAVREFWWLWIGLVLLALVMIRVVAAIGKRRRLLSQGGRPLGKGKPIKDAWAEAGRRAEPLPPESDDEAER